MSFAHDAPAGGAPILQVALSILITAGFLAPCVVLVVAERTGRATALGRLADRTATRIGLPRWAALPSVSVSASLLSAGVGVFWDVPYHMDLGRDQGPLATPAHYLILFGLLGVFASGLLSCGLATDPLPRHTLTVLPARGRRPRWHVPLGSVIITVSGGFAVLGFPLDDLWHRVFGQDVTEWGPTHVLMIGGAVLATLGVAVLAAESRQVGANVRAVRLLEFRCAQGWLLGISVFLMEYDLGVPQFPMLAQVVIVAVAATWALVWARSVFGRGGALLATAVFLVARMMLALLVSGGFGRTPQHFSLFVAQAVLIELLAALVPVTQRYRFGVIAGVLVGTLGTAAEWVWAQVYLPLPWPAGQLPSYLGHGLLAGVGAGLLAGWQLRRLDRIGSPTADPATVREHTPLMVGAALVFGLLALSVPRVADTSIQGRILLTPAEAGTAVVTVRLNDSAAVDDAVWFYTLSWQGGGSIRTPMRRQSATVWQSRRPVPITGDWKTLIRIHKPDNYLVALPVYLPADAAVPVPEVPARSGITRAFQPELHLLQREARTGLPQTVWYGGYATLLLAYLALFVTITMLHARAARPTAITTEVSA